MGIITELAGGRKSISLDSGLQMARSPTDRGEGRRIWRELFSTDKETGSSQAYSHPVRGGSYGRSVVHGGEAQKRLLQALRSMAPGGWSDDRWEQTKHFRGAPYAAIRTYMRYMGQSEFQVFRKDEHSQDGKRPVTKFDPPEGGRMVKPYHLVELLEKPNNQDTFGLMLQRWTQQMALTGTALTWMVPNKLGTPMELYPIPTAIAIPQPAVNPDFPDGYWRIQPLYPYGPFSSYPTPATAVGAPIPAQWMLRFLYPHPLLRYDGFSPLSGLNLEIDEFEMMGRSRHSSMRRGINPSAILNLAKGGDGGEQPLPPEEIDRIHAEWENELQGPDNAGKLIVGTPGGELEQFGSTPKDMDYPQGWAQLLDFILGAGFGVNKAAAGMLGELSYATLFAGIKAVYLCTLQPDANDIAAQLTRHLAPFFGDDLIVEIRCPRIDDHEITFQRADRMAQHQAGTYNELRKLLEMPVTKEEWGNKRIGIEQMEAQQQQQMGGMMGAPGGGMPGIEGAIPGAEQNGTAPPPNPMGGEEQEPAQEEPEVTESRPTPGPLGVGSLGPRKSLNGKTKSLGKKKPKKALNFVAKRKSMTELAAQVCVNGTH